MELTTKVCTKCKNNKPITEFYKRKTGKCGSESHCKMCGKLRRITWEKNNSTRSKQTKKIYFSNYYKANQKKLKNNAKIRRNQNPQYDKNYRKLRKTFDILFTFKTAISKLITVSLKAKKYGKKTRTHQLLGADFDTVFEHLKTTAKINYGAWCPIVKYHIDHIIPCASAKTEEELIKLQHYTNLQYLLPKDNMTKRDKLDYITPYMETLK